MGIRLTGARLTFAAAVVVLATACSRTPAPEITLIGTGATGAVEVRGLPRHDLDALAGASTDAWHRILRVSVAGSADPIAGEYAVIGNAIRFTPMYGLDAGRAFTAMFDPTTIPGADAAPWRQVVTRTLELPGPALARTTVVKRIYPSGESIAANTLRLYIEFSAPMGRGSALEHISLLDDTGAIVMEPFLPVEAEFWSADRTRFTLFFDPGRVKRGIKPNRDLGRALVPGKRYSLVISDRWLDGKGQPLKQTARHEFTVSPPIEAPLDPSTWGIQPPPAGSTDPLIVTFPWPLDVGLLQRALGVRRGGNEVAGEMVVETGETGVRFVPRVAWTPGDHSLMVLPILEDPAGNRPGRAFEIISAGGPEPGPLQLPFSIR